MTWRRGDGSREFCPQSNWCQTFPFMLDTGRDKILKLFPPFYATQWISERLLVRRKFPPPPCLERSTVFPRSTLNLPSELGKSSTRRVITPTLRRAHWCSGEAASSV